MKWFRHVTDASNDEFLAALEAELGLEAYARWWKMLEAIGSQMKPGCPRAAATYSVEKWMGYLSIKQRKILERFVNFCQNHNKISTKFSGKFLEIECAKLLELRDEYSKKSGHRPEKSGDDVPPHITDTEPDTEKDVVFNKTTLGSSDSGDSMKTAPEVVALYGQLVADIGGSVWEGHRPWPAATDSVTAARFIQQGASVDFLRGYLQAELSKFKARGHLPPKSLKYFEQGVANELARLNAPPVAPSVRGQSPVADRRAQIEAAIAASQAPAAEAAHA